MRQIRTDSRIAVVAASMHPAAAMRGMGQFRRPIATVLGRAARWAERTDLPARKFDLALDPSPEEVAERLARVPAKAVVAVDVETPRDRPTEILLVGVSDGDGRAMVFPFGPNVLALREFLARTDVLKVWHNGAYDHRAFRANGCPVAWPHADTIQLAARVRPPFREAKERRWLALSTCALLRFDGWAYWKEAETPSIRAWYRALGYPEHLIDRAYCGFDVVWTRRLWFAESEMARRLGVWEVYEKVTAPCAAVLHEMEWDGMLVDRALLERYQAETLAEAERLEAEVEGQAAEAHAARRAAVAGAVGELDAQITALEDPANYAAHCPKHKTFLGFRQPAKGCETCGMIFVAQEAARAKRKALMTARTKGKAVYARISETFPHNDNAWRALLFEPPPVGMGLAPIDTTGTGLPKVDKESIEALWRRNPDIPLLRSRVALQHAYQRFHYDRKGRAKGSLALTLDAADITHITLSMHRTENARIAAGKDDAEEDKARPSEVGNIQNKPDRDRRVFIAPPGMLLIEWDWSQVEARVEAWLAEEYAMLDAWRAGRDIHSINGAALAHALAGTLPANDPRREVYAGVTEQTADEVMFRFGGVEVSFRYGAKRATHGWDYGMLALKTARLYGIPVRVAQALIDAYFAQWPKLLTFQRRIVETVLRTHELRNVFGSRLEFFGFEKDRAGGWKLKDREEALAFPAANTVAEMVKTAIGGPGRYGMREVALECGGRLYTTTHDSYLMPVPESRVEDALRLGRPIMEQKWPQFPRLPEPYGEFWCPADAMVGRNWGKWHATENPEGVRKVKR